MKLKKTRENIIKNYIKEIIKTEELDNEFLVYKNGIKYKSRTSELYGKLNKCKTIEEIIAFCKEEDKQNHTEYEKEICKKFGIKYTGKINLQVILHNCNWLYTLKLKECNEMVYDNAKLIINGKEYKDINGLRSIEFCDKTIEIKEDVDILRSIEYLKELKMKIKLQEIKNDF